MRMPRKVTLEIRQIVHLPRVTVEFHQIVSALATKSYKLNCYASELVLDWTSAWQNCDCAISFVYPEVSQLNFPRWKCDMCNIYIHIYIYIYTYIIISLWFFKDPEGWCWTPQSARSPPPTGLHLDFAEIESQTWKGNSAKCQRKLIAELVFSFFSFLVGAAPCVDQLLVFCVSEILCSFLQPRSLKRNKSKHGASFV